MFAKLMKHEWRATRGVLGLICLICVSAAVLGGLSMRYLTWISTQLRSMNLVNALCVIAMIVSMIAVAVCGMAELIYLIWRFYKSRYTDEGYLTFTLPVTTHQILLSSVVNSIVGMVIVAAVVLFSIAGMLLIGFSWMDGFWASLGEVISQLFAEMKRYIGWEQLGYAAILLCDGLMGVICGLVMLMLSVTIGSVIARKHKILAAVGTYYGLSVLMSVGETVLLSLVTIRTGEESGYFLRITGFSGLLLLAISVGGYFLTHYLADRKLNLT